VAAGGSGGGSGLAANVQRQRSDDEEEKEVAERWKDFLIPLHELKVAWNDKAAVLSENGGGSRVLRGEYRGSPVAVKEIKRDSQVGGSLRAFETEIRRQTALADGNIVSVLGVSRRNRDILIITEMSSQRTLHQLLHDGDEAAVNKGAPLPQRLRLALDVARGMRYLHRARVTHGDLRPHHVVLDESGGRLVARVTDAALGRVLRDIGGAAAASAAQSIAYTAPEALEGEEVSFPADVYSFAMVLYELVTLKQPFADAAMTPAVLLRKIASGLRPRLPESMDEPTRALLTRCWEAEPGDRPSFAEVVAELERMVGAP
jgi:serine/threonine protein kinase